MALARVERKGLSTLFGEEESGLDRVWDGVKEGSIATMP